MSCTLGNEHDNDEVVVGATSDVHVVEHVQEQKMMNKTKKKNMKMRMNGRKIK